MKKTIFILMLTFAMLFAYDAAQQSAQAQNKVTTYANAAGFEYSGSIVNIDSAFSGKYTFSWFDAAQLAGKTIYFTYSITGDAAYRKDTLLAIIQGGFHNSTNKENIDTIYCIKDTIRSGVAAGLMQATISPTKVFPEMRIIVEAKTSGVTDNISLFEWYIWGPAMNTWSWQQKFNDKR